MNLPNRLTLLRIALVPVCMGFLALQNPDGNLAAAVVFALASATDFLDGYIARKQNLITSFGKFMDPIADKLLVLLPMMQMTLYGMPVSLWAVMVMMAREIAVSGFRLVAAGRGIVLAADRWGKVKTVLQMLAVLMAMLAVPYASWVVWASALVSALSAVLMIIKNRAVLKEFS